MKEFIPCECGGEVLALEYDEDDEVLYLSMISRSPHRWSWRQRFRFAWLALRGKLYLDDIVLKQEGINRMWFYLVEHTPEPKEEK